MTRPGRPGSSRRQRALLDRHAAHRRSLPWRDTTDPYHILVSEVMLQQTQAGRVAERFVAFLERFPDAAALAAAPLGDVLEKWAGLGYYRRAQRLREAARRVADGGWPDTVAGLRRLPGIGDYTAAAVACFAFGEHVAVVDTNVRRVLSRWAGRPLAGAALRAAATAELPAGRARDWNEAVMDLGAEVCTARAPACSACPVRAWCGGPAAYVPPPRQGRYEGSTRQARGAVLRTLGRDGPVIPVADLAPTTGLAAGRVAAAVRDLEVDGLVITSEAGVRLAP